ncbi:MAG TPA: 16S rRNA (cytosine(967)-C(5))-methyltransferase RsmB [Candidatus Saccharimonadaceae bacterium]|nr:16S rRNA (cytosine(967)-C(5))-methyltransferase RsmB [Candidatus Saccharimonadaceae bacterium]
MPRTGLASDRRGGDRAPRPGGWNGPTGGRIRTGPPPRGPRPGANGDWNRKPQGAPFEDDRSLPPLPSNPREAALRILHAADTRSAFSDRLLDGAHSRGGPDVRDQALMHELVKGTLRWRGRLDHALDGLVHIGLSQVQPWVKNILRMGAYQILFLDRIPPHAAVDESVKLAHKYGHPGTAGLVNSVLRRMVEQKDTLLPPEGDDAASLAVWGSHPLWIVERWLARFGVEATRALLLADNRTVKVGLRVNPLRGTREQLIEKLAAEGVESSPATLSPDLVWVETHQAPGALAAFKRGLCTVQDESEALVSRLVDPKPHERLLDLCAAPGGKCTHLAELMGDEGEVWAMERNESRVASLQSTVDRLGVQAVHVVQGDGRLYTFPMPFDRVLVDAPCTGLGVLGRRADARWRKGPEMLREMPPIQLELLVAGGKRLRPGGVLVYSVCSFEPEETTEVVERFLRENPEFVLESPDGLLPAAVLDEQGFMRVLPHVHGCDGAFAARFRRT